MMDVLGLETDPPLLLLKSNGDMEFNKVFRGVNPKPGMCCKLSVEGQVTFQHFHPFPDKCPKDGQDLI